MVAHVYNLAPDTLRQEDCHGFEVSLSYLKCQQQNLPFEPWFCPSDGQFYWGWLSLTLTEERGGLYLIGMFLGPLLYNNLRRSGIPRSLLQAGIR